MRSVSFDVDGTLIDNKQLVRQAYEMAGITMSDDEWASCFGKTFSEWLVERCGGDYQKAWEVHRVKNERYALLVAEQNALTVLPPTHLARELRAEGDVYFVTGASNVAANTVLMALGLDVHPAFVNAALSIEGKIEWIIELDTVHIDDDIRIVEGLLDRGYPYVVHYTIGDSLDGLRAAVEYLWTP